MHDLIVKVGDAIPLSSGSSFVVKLIATNGQTARLRIDVPNSSADHTVKKLRNNQGHPLSVAVGETT